jgi:hypothetical protein
MSVVMVTMQGYLNALFKNIASFWAHIVHEMCLNEYGEPMERYWLQKVEVLEAVSPVPRHLQKLPTWTVLGLNPDLCSKRPANNRQNRATAPLMQGLLSDSSFSEIWYL